MEKTIQPKTKAQLDNMTREGIGKYRTAYLSQHNAPEKVVRRYMKELELYMEIRFKDEVFARYKRWEKNEKDKSIAKIDRDALKLVNQMIKKFGGPKEYYKLTIENNKKELGEMQYIIL